MKNKTLPKHIKVIDDTVKLPDKEGNGLLKYSASVDSKGKMVRYSFSYINFHLCTTDNGRVLGYDNCHGYHHKHFMGEEEEIEFLDLEDIQNRFEDEWGTYMNKLKSKKTGNQKKRSLKNLSVKIGSVKAFFSSAREVMRAADKGEPIKKRCATLTFIDPTEMLHFLSASKIQLINTIRNHPDSISNIAKATHRKVEAIRRDVREMESVGIVKTYTEINATGHGRHKVVQLAAPALKLEAFI